MGTVIRSSSTLLSLSFPHLLQFRFCCSPFCWHCPICSHSFFFHFSFTAIQFPVSSYPSIFRPVTCASCYGETSWGREGKWVWWHSRGHSTRWQRYCPTCGQLYMSPSANEIGSAGIISFCEMGNKSENSPTRIQFNSLAPSPIEYSWILTVPSQEGILLWESRCHLIRNLCM